MRHHNVAYSLFALFFVSCATVRTPPPLTYSGAARESDISPNFIVVGDVQLRGFPEIFLFRENNRDAVQALFQKIATELPSFVLILGDLTFPGSSMSAWADFDSLAKPLHDRGIPIYPLPGNHEYPGDSEVAFRQYFGRFPATGGELWYSVKWKDIGIITLNSNFGELSSKQVMEQGKWYLAEMERMQSDSSVTAIIVACHHPPFTNSTTVHDDQMVQSSFVPAYLNTEKAKLFFSGHCHSYERFNIEGKHFIVSGGGGPRQSLAKPPQHSIKQDLFKGGCKREHHYCKVTTCDDTLRVEMIRMNDESGHWSVGDSVMISRK